jgi:putative restriction endonuclease
MGVPGPLSPGGVAGNSGKIGLVEGVDPVERLLALRQHQRAGKRSPHKPLLVLLAMSRLSETGSSALPWSVVEDRLARLLADYGPPSRASGPQSAAFPFTRLRSDGVWTLDADVPMDRVTPLTRNDVVGRLTPQIEARLADPRVLHATARMLVDAEFPPTVAPDVLTDAGLDPDLALTPSNVLPAAGRRRDAAWRARVLLAWDRHCAFCGYDGQLGHASVGIEAAHVRWFTFDGPDTLDNGLALCSLHHKLLDHGALGLTDDHRILVSGHFTARTPAGQRVYDLTGRALQPRPGTSPPATEHIRWHRREVFKST